MEWMIAFEIYFKIKKKKKKYAGKIHEKIEWNNNRNNWKGIVLKSIGGTKGFENFLIPLFPPPLCTACLISFLANLPLNQTAG